MEIINFGSLNIDLVYQVDHIVRPGETIASSAHQVFAGGKGANQSAALAHAGAAVRRAARQETTQQAVETCGASQAATLQTGTACEDRDAEAEGLNSISLMPYFSLCSLSHARPISTCVSVG